MNDETFNTLLQTKVDSISMSATETWKIEMDWRTHFVAGAHAAREFGRLHPSVERRETLEVADRYKRKLTIEKNRLGRAQDKFDKAWAFILELEQARMSPGLLLTVIKNAKKELMMM